MGIAEVLGGVLELWEYWGSSLEASRQTCLGALESSLRGIVDL
jgi:hypothetical protein